MTGQNEAKYLSAQAEMQAKLAIAAEIGALMTRYSFDLGGHSSERWIDQWLQQYPPLWLQVAVVEALYQGRYKAVSVWQILDLWQRRGKPLRHFNREFERMVAGRTLHLLFSTEAAEAASSSPVASPLPHAEPPDNSPPALIYDLEDRPIQPLLPVPQPPGPQPQITPYRPSQQFYLALPEKISLLQPRAPQAPIQRFVPTPEASEFHSKLKSIAQALILANAQIISNKLATRQGAPAELPAESLECPEDASLS